MRMAKFLRKRILNNQFRGLPDGPDDPRLDALDQKFARYGQVHGYYCE